MKYDLGNPTDRQAYIESIQKEFILRLRAEGLELHETAVCSIRERNIEIGTQISQGDRYQDFGSTISLYRNNLLGSKGPVEVSSATTGSFSPFVNDVQKYRAIHFGQVVQNWEKVVPAALEYWIKIDGLMATPIAERFKKDQ